jgi:hypothetical protein
MKMEQSVQERIRQRAYQLWDTSGRMNGQAEQHWLAAEREILAERLVASPAMTPLRRSKRSKAA